MGETARATATEYKAYGLSGNETSQSLDIRVPTYPDVVMPID